MTPIRTPRPAKPDELARLAAPFTDTQGRQIRYLRLSLTDRCNLRCLYCRGGQERFIPHPDVLRYEELEDLVTLAAEHGVGKVRITGGEPFARKGCLAFLERLRLRHPALDIRLTTNGTLVGPYIGALKDLGLNAMNLSLDSFRPERFAQITGRDLLDRVLDCLDRVLNAGIPLKLNAVALRGLNDDELPAFLNFARTNPVDVRFIEFMPMGEGTAWTPDRFWPAPEILKAAEALIPLQALPWLGDDASGNISGKLAADAGPARLYALAPNDGPPARGRFGLITPLSHHFCHVCNRLRVTSDGRLRTCLFADAEYRLRPALRHPKLGLEAVRRILAAANLRKPLGTALLEARRQTSVARKRMIAIGG